MSVKRTIDLFSGKQFFTQELPLYVNRSVESFELTEHRHDFIEIACVSEGSGTHYVAERSLPVAAGDIFLLPVGLSHVFRPSTPSEKPPLIVYNCLLSPEAVDTLVGSIPGGRELAPVLQTGTLRRYRDRNGEFDRLFRELHAEYASARPGREAALFAGVIRLLLALYRCEAEARQPPVVAAPGLDGLDAALATLNSRPEQPPSVPELARLAGVGTRQFHRLFVQRTGMTPTDYAQNIRIREACRLLADTDRKVADIAASVGYRNVPFFNALFRRKTGLSPREYKRRARADAPSAD